MTHVETYDAERNLPEFLEQELQQYAINIKSELYNCCSDVASDRSSYESKYHEILFNDEQSRTAALDSDTLVYRFLYDLIKNRDSYDNIGEFFEKDYELKINDLFRIEDPQYPINDIFPNTDTHSITPEEAIREPEDTNRKTILTVDFILTKQGLTQKINHVFIDPYELRNFPTNISEVLFLTGVKDAFMAESSCIGTEQAEYTIKEALENIEGNSIFATNDITKAHQYKNRENADDLDTIDHFLFGSVLDYPPEDITWYNNKTTENTSTYLKNKALTQYIYEEDNKISDFEIFCLDAVPYVSDPNKIEKGIPLAVHWIESSIREIVNMDEQEYDYLGYFNWLSEKNNAVSDDFDIEDHFNRIRQSDNYQTPLEEELKD